MCFRYGRGRSHVRNTAARVRRDAADDRSQAPRHGRRVPQAGQPTNRPCIRDTLAARRRPFPGMIVGAVQLRGDRRPKGDDNAGTPVRATAVIEGLD